MWQLLKAELAYHRLSIACVFGVFLALHLTVLEWGWRGVDTEYYGMRSILFTASMLFWLARFIRISKEKVDRYHVILPVRNRSVGAARVLVFIVFWMCMVCLFSFGFLLVRPEEMRVEMLWDLLSLTGLMLAVNTLPLIHFDLMRCASRGYQKVVLTVIYAMVIFLCIGLVTRFPSSVASLAALQKPVVQFSAMPAGTGLMLLLGVGFTFASVMIFQRRKSYAA